MTQDTHFQRQMHQIKEDVLRMGGLVESAIHQAIRALLDRNHNQARAVIRGDKAIDRLDNEIDRQCLNLIATRQPVAGDLRLLTGVFRLCTILERMGDQAVNLAQRTLALVVTGDSTTPEMLLAITRIAQDMTADCLDAFLREDMDLASKVLKRDDELDDLNHSLFDEMVEWMSKNPGQIMTGVQLLLASRHLERIGDLATNVAEEVFFLAKGRLVRHGGRENKQSPPKDK